MGVALASGSIKYVFTQATAPSGEGEVQGSLWYDTTTNMLYTYDGAAWTAMATNTGGNIFLNLACPASVGAGTWSMSLNAAYVYQGCLYNPTYANADNISYTAYFPIGTYTLKLAVTKSSAMGILDVDIDGAEVASFDNYAAGSSSGNVLTQTGITISAAGVYDIRFRVDGKNASSSGYQCFIEAASLYRTA